MKVTVVGAGEMGLAMAGHIKNKEFETGVVDLNPERLALASEQGLPGSDNLADVVKDTDVYIAIVATDEQVISVAKQLAGSAKKGSTIVVAATIHPDTMPEIEAILKPHGIGVVDAPVVYGAAGAREGTLLSLAGGSEADVERVRPVLMSYSRNVLHVGAIGAGQVAKSCNNLLHWIHCVGNFEALLLAKRYGLDAQRMREVLLQCPGDNVTLRRWDSTRFTWQEKDMDLTLDLAQKLGLMLPLSGQVDQIIKTLNANDVKGLLYGDEAVYLGQRVTATSVSR